MLYFKFALYGLLGSLLVYAGVTIKDDPLLFFSIISVVGAIDIAARLEQ
jgi:hypothetical protein